MEWTMIKYTIENKNTYIYLSYHKSMRKSIGFEKNGGEIYNEFYYINSTIIINTASS